MKSLILAVLLLLIGSGVGHAQTDFRSFSWGSYGTISTYSPTTADDLEAGIDGRPLKFGGFPADLYIEDFPVGPTSVSDNYDVGAGFIVTFSASAISPARDPLLTGGEVSASNNRNPGAATIIAETYAYASETVAVRNATNLDQLLKSYEVTLSLDGVVRTSGDAIVLVGEAIRIDVENAFPTTTAQMREFRQGLSDTYNFGQPGQPGGPITLTHSGPNGAQLLAQASQSITIETLLYLRAQTGALRHQIGTAEADFSHTLRISNIRFYDENDQVIPGLEVIGSDGYVYPYNVAVPEPSTLAIVAAGCIGLAIARLRCTQRCRACF